MKSDNKYRLSLEIPEWLVNLPPGKYLIREVVQITKASKSNIYQRFAALNVKKEVTERYGIKFNEYDWKGAAYHLQQCYEVKKQQMEKKNESKKINSI